MAVAHIEFFNEGSLKINENSVNKELGLKNILSAVLLYGNCNDYK